MRVKVRVVEIRSDDSWVRDTGPTFVVKVSPGIFPLLHFPRSHHGAENLCLSALVSCRTRTAKGRFEAWTGDSTRTEGRTVGLTTHGIRWDGTSICPTDQAWRNQVLRSSCGMSVGRMSWSLGRCWRWRACTGTRPRSSWRAGPSTSMGRAPAWYVGWPQPLQVHKGHG